MVSRLVGVGSLMVLPTFGACGDDNSNERADAKPQVDGGNVITADASPTATRNATLAITEIDVRDSAAVPTTRLTGGSFSLSVSDLTGDSPAPVFGDGSLGSCTVFKYTQGETAPPPLIDEGAITIGGPGLLKPNPNPCTFNTAAGRYLCVADGGASPAGNISSGGAGTATISITGETFGPGTQAQVGMYLQISGNDVAAVNGLFPIVAVPNATTLAIAGAIPALAAVPYTATSYALLQGVGPVPGGSPVAYLDSSVDPGDVTISMAGTDAFPAGIDLALEPIAAGLTLGATQPYQFPQTAQAVTFSCDEADGGDCGTDPSTGDIKAFIVTGSSTSGSIAGLPSFSMPATAAGNEYTTFQCTFLAPSTKGTIPAAAVAAILDTTPAPTRIETRVIRANGSVTFVGPGAANQLGVLVGRALVGHTNIGN